MSWCRFSSDSYRCDLYVYETEHDVVANVAAFRKKLGDGARFPDLSLPPEAFADACAKFFDALRDAETVPIGGPFDGDFREFGDFAEARKFVSECIDAGYRAPANLLSDMLEEIDSPTEY